MSMILAIDQGTTGTRAILFDRGMKARGSAYLEHRQYFPAPGWVEHDAEEIWANTLKVVGLALKKAGAAPAQVACIGITNQRETSLVWDSRSGKPLHRAIVWQCRRSQAICEKLKRRGLEPLFRRRTGLRLDPYFSGTKLTWLIQNSPAVRAAFKAGRARFGTMDSFLAWRLSRGQAHVTDFTNASRTLMFDIRRRRWDPELARLLGVTLDCLPEARPSSGHFADSDPSVFAGIRAPLTGMAGDQQAALFGQGCWSAGEAKNTYGTGSFLLLNTGSRPGTSRRGLLTTLACGPGGSGAYALEGSVFTGGAAVQWLRDGLGILKDSAQSEGLAASIPDSGGVVFVPALTGLGAPDWDPSARGAFFGLTRGSSRAALVRAVLEAIAIQVAELLDLMRRESGLDFRSLNVDGGATANRFLMQFQADLLGKPVAVAAVSESTALGAAALAGLGAGWITSPALKRGLQAGRRVFRPRRGAGWRREVKGRFRRAVEAVKNFSS